MRPVIEDQMARHVPEEVSAIWTPEARVRIHRMIWCIVLTAHMQAGVVEYDADILRALDRALPDIDLAAIEQRERITRHDVKASLEEYIHVAAVPEVLHLGMTSADVVDNMSLIQMAQTCRVLGELADDDNLRNWSQWLPFRGIVGPVGTGQDQLDLMRGDQDAYDQFQSSVYQAFGFRYQLTSVGQVYPRSMDLSYATALMPLAICHQATARLAGGYMAMIAGYSGDQWNEGDVSSSVVRRVALPGITFAAAAGLVATF